MVEALEEKEIEETEKEETPDILDISDEDFAKLEEPLDPEEQEEEENSEESNETETEEEEEEDLEDDTGDSEEEEDEDSEETEDEEENDTEDSEEESELKKKKAIETEETEKEEKDSKEDESETKSTVDYESEYKKLMAPFKANGHDITAKSTEDAITLMQMGANYHKKMADIKPALKTVKLLEKNDLLDPSKLNFLIDLHHRKPEAITQLLKDSGIDPMDVDVKSDEEYTPTTHSVSDKEMELDAALDKISSTPTYAQTLDVITKKWDQKSRETAATTPHIIPIINGQIADGTYDTVMNAVEYERRLGNLTSISDFDAYRQMGNILEKAGKIGKKKEDTKETTSMKKTIPTKKDKQRKARKKAASPTKTGKTLPPKKYDPLSMSDEEFAKFDKKHSPFT